MTSNANLSDGNFNMIGLAQGTAKSVRILGIGGLSKKALVFEAKKDLYSNFPLKKGQVFANMSVDVTNRFILVYHETLVTISADIIDFTDASSSEKENQHLHNKRTYQIGDTVTAFFRQQFVNAIVTNINGSMLKIVHNGESVSMPMTELRMMNESKKIENHQFKASDIVDISYKGKVIKAQILSYDKDGIKFRYKTKNKSYRHFFYNDRDVLKNIRNSDAHD